jgi:hypothetical protein
METQYFDIDNLTLIKGDDWQQTYQYVDAKNKPINISGFSVSFVAYDGQGGAVITASAVLDDPTKGVFRFLVLDIGASLAVGVYEYAISITDNSNISTTRIKGRLELVLKSAKSDCGGC